MASENQDAKPAEEVVHPILRHSDQPKHVHPEHISFDEEVIKEHDKLRGTRQKILEANTPFPREGQLPPDLTDLHARLESSKEELPSAAAHSKKSDFEEKRRRHYDEMQRVREAREQSKTNK